MSAQFLENYDFSWNCIKSSNKTLICVWLWYRVTVPAFVQFTADKALYIAPINS